MPNIFAIRLPDSYKVPENLLHVTSDFWAVTLTYTSFLIDQSNQIKTNQKSNIQESKQINKQTNNTVNTKPVLESTIDHYEGYHKSVIYDGLKTTKSGKYTVADLPLFKRILPVKPADAKRQLRYDYCLISREMGRTITRNELLMHFDLTIAEFEAYYPSFDDFAHEMREELLYNTLTEDVCNVYWAYKKQKSYVKLNKSEILKYLNFSDTKEIAMLRIIFNRGTDVLNMIDEYCSHKKTNDNLKLPVLLINGRIAKYTADEHVVPAAVQKIHNELINDTLDASSNMKDLFRASIAAKSKPGELEKIIKEKDEKLKALLGKKPEMKEQDFEVEKAKEAKQKQANTEFDHTEFADNELDIDDINIIDQLDEPTTNLNADPTTNLNADLTYSDTEQNNNQVDIIDEPIDEPISNLID